jgi:hypothetical protein
MPVTPAQDLTLHLSHIYPMQLHLSKLTTTTTTNVYAYLAAAQKTRYAVTSVHTSEEFELFNKSVSVGGEWCPQHGTPNFDQMAIWWSSKANGKNIFYKLQEHLSSHHKTWLECRKRRETLVASQEQKRAHAASHIAQVLPAASCEQPGVLINSDISEQLPDDLQNQ